MVFFPNCVVKFSYRL